MTMNIFAGANGCANTLQNPNNTQTGNLKVGNSNSVLSDCPIFIRHGEDFSGIMSPTRISEKEFTYGMLLFTFKNNQPVISGLYRVGVIELLAKSGFYKKYMSDDNYVFIKEVNNIIEEVEPCRMVDSINDYIDKMEEEIRFDYAGLRVSYFRDKLKEIILKHTNEVFNKNFLSQLPIHDKPIMRDDSNTTFFYFNNVIEKITEDGREQMQYSELNDNCIWRKQIIQRDFCHVPDFSGCHYEQFIKNISSNEDDRIQSVKSAIGYLLHNYCRKSMGQAVILYDEEITDIKNPQGGTGKGLFANALKEMRNVTKIDGKKFDASDKFRYQNVTEQTQIAWFDDIKPDLAFETFHSCLTDGWSIERKRCDQILIEPEYSPKTLFCSNSVLNNGGTTNKRRQFVIEFASHYSKQIVKGNEEPIRMEHGCIFFDKECWDEAEWNKFYSFMLNCAVGYMKKGLLTYAHKNLEKNILRQNTGEDFIEWVEEQKFILNEKYVTKTYYETFKKENIEPFTEFKTRTFTNWLKMFATSKGWKMDTPRSNSIQGFIFRQ